VTTITPTATRTTRRPALLSITSLLFALFGTLKLSATVYFGFFASAAARGHREGIGDWLVAGWSIAVGAGYLLVAARLGHERRGILRLAGGLAMADVAFSAVKIFVYHESEGVAFLVVTLLLLALLALVHRRPR
jgi:hypothetical protein